MYFKIFKVRTIILHWAKMEGLNAEVPQLNVGGRASSKIEQQVFVNAPSPPNLIKSFYSRTPGQFHIN